MSRKSDEPIREWPTLTVRVPQDIYDSVVEIAEKIDRSLSHTGLILIELGLDAYYHEGKNDV